MSDSRMNGLTDDQLNTVTGGTGTGDHLAAGPQISADLGKHVVQGLSAERESVADAVIAAAGSTVKSLCLVCGKETAFRIHSGGRAYCSVCGAQKFM